MKTLGEMARSIGSVLVEGNIGTFYHGSTHKIGTFSDEFVNQGNNELGPGIYFSSEIKDALAYSGDDGFIYEVQISLRKDLNISSKVNPRVIKSLLMASPDEYAWSNWSENKNEGIQLGLNNILEVSSNMLEAIHEVWGDWYKGDEVALVRQLSKIGYDGTIYKNAQGSSSTWVVVYNPQSISVLKIYPASQIIKNGA